jgi:hypothetical protein
MKKILLLALSLSAANAFASDWQYVGGPTDASNYMDFASFGTVNGYRKVWIRTDFSTPRETSGYPKKQYLSAKYLYYFDCNGKLLSAFQEVLYEKLFAQGDVVSTTTYKFDPKQLTDIVPDSVGENLLNVACSDAERAKVRAKNKAADKEFLKFIEDANKKAKEQKRDADNAAPTGT